MSETRLRFEVGDQDTALAVGSGSLPVLGTPRLVAWCEAATCAAIDPLLPPGATSVGTRVEVEHRAPSAIGRTLVVAAEVASVEGRTYRFRVRAAHEDGEEVASGWVTRAVVEIERFLARLDQEGGRRG